jgi:hypothetical protein
MCENNSNILFQHAKGIYPVITYVLRIHIIWLTIIYLISIPLLVKLIQNEISEMTRTNFYNLKKR